MLCQEFQPSLREPSLWRSQRSFELQKVGPLGTAAQGVWGEAERRVLSHTAGLSRCSGGGSSQGISAETQVAFCEDPPSHALDGRMQSPGASAGTEDTGSLKAEASNVVRIRPLWTHTRHPGIMVEQEENVVDHRRPRTRPQVPHHLGTAEKGFRMSLSWRDTEG